MHYRLDRYLWQISTPFSQTIYSEACASLSFNFAKQKNFQYFLLIRLLSVFYEANKAAVPNLFLLAYPQALKK